MRTSLRWETGVEHALRPRGLLIQEVHRGEDVQEHSEGEEIAHAFRRRTGDTLDVVEQCAVAVSNDVTDIGVVAVGVRLHLRSEPGAVPQEADIRLADRVERFLTRLAGGRILEELERLAQAAAHDLEVELLLGSEEPEQVRLRDTRLAGEVIVGRAVEAVI